MLLKDIREERVKKIQILKIAGMEPYPSQSFRDTRNFDFLEEFEKLEKSKKDITLAGRVMSLRKQGGVIFCDLFDGTAKVQIVLKKDDFDEKLFNLLIEVVDVSDFIEVKGHAFVTRKEVRSLQATTWRMLAKSLRPVPDQWFGLKDEDERYRKRYLDMLLNEDVRELIKKRAVFWNSIRHFMNERGFIEVETPALETLPGGAEARPFITHHNALDTEVYLRISVGELWQKKLMVAGFNKTFEIGRIFRNEGMSPEHAQDYTSFEFYEAYQDSREGVEMIKKLYRYVAKETFGTTKFRMGIFDVDFEKDWKDLNFNDLMKKEFGFDPRSVLPEEMPEILKRNSIKFEKGIELPRAVDLLWKKLRKTIGGPAVLTGMPVYMEPLAKKSVDDPTTVERFQIIIAGSEVGKAFNELNDPIDQLERFEDQQAMRDAGDEEAQMADYEYVEAMEYGMPPVFGFGVSERLFSFLAGKSIRECQAFPLMKPRK